VKGINLYAIDNEKRTVLHAAMYSGNELAVEFVLAKELQFNLNKPKLVNSEDINKRTPLFYASTKYRLPSLPGANPLVKDTRGLTVIPIL
jgi:ankyrin repeat protein